MRVCDKCLDELTNKKTFNIIIEGYNSCGALLHKDNKRYEVCEECANRVMDILKRSSHQAD